MKNVWKILAGKPDGKRTFGRTRKRWEIVLNLKELKKYGVKMWTGFIWLRVGSKSGIL
jgi:hypothetical protein